MSVVLRLSDGVAEVLGHSIAVAPVDDGGLRVGGAFGPVLRPLTFTERTSAAELALTVDDGRQELIARVMAHAVVNGQMSDGLGDEASRDAIEPMALRALALHLSGAGSGGPSFTECAVLAARTLGWGPQDLQALPAQEVDRLVDRLGQGRPTESASGWNRVVFQESPSSKTGTESEELAALVDRLADDLLQRAAGGIDKGLLTEPLQRSGEAVGIQPIRTGDQPPPDAGPIGRPPATSPPAARSSASGFDGPSRPGDDRTAIQRPQTSEAEFDPAAAVAEAPDDTIDLTVEPTAVQAASVAARSVWSAPRTDDDHSTRTSTAVGDLTDALHREPSASIFDRVDRWLPLDPSGPGVPPVPTPGGDRSHALLDRPRQSSAQLTLEGSPLAGGQALGGESLEQRQPQSHPDRTGLLTLPGSERSIDRAVDPATDTAAQAFVALSSSTELAELADAMALELHRTADLRGIAR